MSILERLEELERRLDQMVVRGYIEAVDCGSHRVRVRFGDESVSDWLEWKPSRSGNVTMWSPPQVGEGCTIISDGDLANGEVLMGSYHSSMPAPSASPDETVIQWPDGTRVVYDMAKHELSVTVAGNVKVKATGDIIADASNIKLNGGKGVVTGAHLCQISGKPHSDCSSTVTAGK